MTPTLLLRYQQMIEQAVDTSQMPSGTATLTKVQAEHGDSDCSVAFSSNPTSGTGTFTATRTEAPDHDYMAIGVDFVFPH